MIGRMLKQITNWFKYLLTVHYINLFKNLDAVRSHVERPTKLSSYNSHFIILLITFIFFFIEGNFILLYEHVGYVSFNLTYLRQTPYIMLHQITPKMVWNETDNCLLVDTLTSAIIFALMIFHYNIPDRVRYYRWINDEQRLINDQKGKNFHIF